MNFNTAIVTGASRGLGRAIAAALAESGLNVVLASRSTPPMDRLAAAGGDVTGATNRLIHQPTDLRDPNSLRDLFAFTRQRFGPVDVLVNNAGIGYYKPLLEWSESEIIDTVNVNLTALILSCQHAARDMLAQRRGFIINIASDLALRFLGNMAPYVAAKSGVRGFTGSLRQELQPHGIRLCTVMPGIIDTGFNAGEEGSRDPAVALQPAELAATVVALLSKPAHVTVDELVIHPTYQEY